MNILLMCHVISTKLCTYWVAAYNNITKTNVTHNEKMGN